MAYVFFYSSPFLPMLSWYPLQFLFFLKMAFLMDSVIQTLLPSSENVILEQQETEMTVANPVN